MERNHLDRLSAELITPILLELPTTQSLYSLIRASPKSYQVFLASKEKILVSLMRQKIQPAAFIDALAAVQASQLREKGPDRKGVLAFLRQYENERQKAVGQKGRHYSLSTATSLCQLYRSSQYFIRELTRRSNFYLRRCAGIAFVQTHRYARLSDVEEGRLQRAFYRYELYTQIFSSDMEYSGQKLWELPSDSHFFLEKYEHWEIEELACVDDYLWSLLSNSFDRIERAFEGSKFPEPPLDDSETASFQSYKRSEALREAKYEIHGMYSDLLSRLSLPFLHHALRLDRLDMQREMSSHIYYDGQKRSLSTALEGLWKEMSRKDRNLLHDYIHAAARNKQFQFQDTMNGSNEGWLWVYGNASFVSPFRIRRTTQSLGNVFWDSRRLRKYGFVATLQALVDIEERCQIKRNVWPSTTAPIVPFKGAAS